MRNSQIKFNFFAIITIATLIAGLVFPSSALADDSVPPEQPATEISGDEVSVEGEATPTPEATETAVVETPRESTATPESTETVLEVTAESTTPTSTEPVSQPVVELTEIVGEMQDAGLILTDENGNPIPLAAESAQEALLAPDPIGCPPGVEPVSWGGTGIGCTMSYSSIQAAIDDVAVIAGWTIYIDPGTFNENVNVNKSVTLQGSGVGVTIVRPGAGSVVDLGCGAGSCASTANTVFYITADNVTIRDLTVDGDNTSVASGTVVNSVDVNARNGIFGNDADNLIVENTQVQNVYLRGIQTTYSDAIEIRNNTINNVDGSIYSISVFNFGGGGVIENNTISQTGDGIASNWSTGTQVLNNTVSDMGTGIHTDNTQGTDVISGNTISNGTSNSYGIFVFAPYQPVSVTNNTITNVDVGLTVSGNGYGDPLNTITFTNNTVASNLIGAYVTTDVWGYFFSNVSAQFNNNVFTGGDYGFYLESSGPGENIGSASGYSYDCPASTCTLNVIGSGNSITGQNLFAATVAYGQPAWFSGVTPVFYGIYDVDLSGNYWGDASGPNDTDTDAVGCQNSNVLTNPSATGGAVSECIIYSSWITPTPTPTSTPTPDDEGNGGNNPMYSVGGANAICKTEETYLLDNEIKVVTSGLCKYEVAIELVILNEQEKSLMGEDSKTLYPELTEKLAEDEIFQFGVSILISKDGQPVQVLPFGAHITILFPVKEGTVKQWSTNWDEVDTTIIEEGIKAEVQNRLEVQIDPWIYILTTK